jgi:TRAP transporter TAXI family solute receptor
MKKVSLIALFVAFTFVFGMVPADVQAKTTFVTIGTGGITGVYYPTGGAIAKMVNAKRKEYGIRATVESTGGSVFNVNAVMSGDLEFGVVQSDRQYQAMKGHGRMGRQAPEGSAGGFQHSSRVGDPAGHRWIPVL